MFTPSMYSTECTLLQNPRSPSSMLVGHLGGVLLSYGRVHVDTFRTFIEL